jgi:uncharacterized protein YcbX
MIETHQPDYRPPSRDPSLTSPSIHPELLRGAFVMRPRIHVKLTDAERAEVAVWSRRMLGVYGIAAVAVWVVSLLVQAVEQDAQAFAQHRPSTAPCMGWDDAASDAIIRLVQSKSDSDLRQVSNAVFQMRRARRNCEGGWVALACQDYQAIVRGSAPALAAASICPTTLARDDAAAHRNRQP